MSRRLKLIVAYDGTQFAGWQSQSHRNTIQDYLERAFERVGDKRVRVHGAGRTDAGVHALALDQRAQLAIAARHTGAPMPLCAEAFPCTFFRQRKNVSL